MTGLPARRLAWEALRAVHANDAYANLVVPRLLAGSRLDERDRALVVELAYGTLRAEGQLDHVIAAGSSRPLDQIDTRLLDVLRLGAYQLLHMRVPPHAAVATSVTLAREVAGEGAAKFANAVLRRVGERRDDLVPPAFDVDPVAHLAVTTAHPEWIVAAFRDALGGDLAETRRALDADNVRPEVHLAARRISPDALVAECVAAGYEATPGRWSPLAVRLHGGDPGALPSVRSGAAGVQDEASQLAALVVHRLLPHVDGADILDLCAGPGGKTALLAALRPAARIVASDLHHHRARLVRQAAGPGPLVVQADGRAPGWAAQRFDAVLLDAPCTGLGALRRRPEARWRRQPGDLAGLVALQAELLRSAVDAVRPGGLVVYVVCSPHRAEGPDQVSDALDRGAVEQVDVRGVLADVPDLGAGPSVQTWPHRHETDALFVTALRRN